MDPQPQQSRRRATVRLGLLAIGCLVLLGLGWWVWRSLHERTAQSVLVLYGNVDIRQVALAFNASDRIESLTAQEGDRVQAGQVLGRLDTRSARLRVAQSAALLAVQEQALRRLLAGSRPEEIDQARAAVASAAAEEALAEQQLARLRQIHESTHGRAVAQLDLDNAVSRRKVAAAQVETARKALALAVKGPRQEDMDQARAQLESTRADKALLERQVEESELKAPNAGIVRARLLEPGDMASPQRPVFTLAILQPKWVRAYVPEPRLSQIRPGMPASVSTDSDPQHPLAGRIGYIAAVAEFTPKTVETEELRTSLVYEVRILVADRNDALRLGMPATVRIDLTGPVQSGRP